MRLWTLAAMACCGAVAPAAVHAQAAPRSPRGLTLSLVGCARPIERALRDDLARPERSRITVVAAGEPVAYRADLRCVGGELRMRVTAPGGIAVEDTLRGVAPHDLREPLLDLLDRVFRLEAEAPPVAVTAPPASASPVGALAAGTPPLPCESRAHWSFYAGGSVRQASAPGTTYWGAAAGATLSSAGRFGWTAEATVERGFNSDEQIGGIATTLFGAALVAHFALLVRGARWTLGLGARGGIASQRETGPRARSEATAWLGTIVTTAVTVPLAPHLGVRAGAELGVSALPAYASVDRRAVASAGPLWFGATLALGWTP